MPRPTKARKVGFVPTVTYFKPVGIELTGLDEVQLGIDELEALRLKDFLGMEQQECAEQMNLAQSSFQRILALARSKVAYALVEGLPIRIEGGNYQVFVPWVCRACGHEWEALLPETELSQRCPSCASEQTENLWHRCNFGGPPPWARARRGRYRGGRG
ncbi:MAG: DUF134 domain-containing protein [Firmicutes bacterium]|nr:DUF134 domain-containing protein [Bacillota bacterium]